MLIDKQVFFDTLNKIIFGKDKPDLIEKVAKSPERYVGLFRPTKPKTKVFQNLSQSHEIRFGDALEETFGYMLKDKGYEILNKNNLSHNGDYLNVDQLFAKKDNSTLYFVEQKVRDDHDSTKKRGQMDNFEKKLNYVLDNFKGKYQKIVGIVYFIDPTLNKNHTFYEQELEKMRKIYDAELFLFYGREFFDYIFDKDKWVELEDLLREWKKTLDDFPIVDYDEDFEESFEIIKNMDFGTIRKLIMNEEVWEEGIMKVLFKNGATLKKLMNYYREHGNSLQDNKYINLADVIKEKTLLYYK